MKEPTYTTEKNELLLTQLILMFQTAAMQHMGKLKNPLSDKIEVNLDQAQISIDMLELIHTKMKGNLTTAEEKILTNVLKELKLNYVEEVSKVQQQSSSSPSSKHPPEKESPS